MAKRKVVLNKSQVIGGHHVDAGAELMVKKESGDRLRVVTLNDTGLISGFVNKKDVIGYE